MANSIPTGPSSVPISSTGRGLILLVILALIFLVGVANLTTARSASFALWLAFLTYACTLAFPFIFHRAEWGWLHPLTFTVLWYGLGRDVLPHIGVYLRGLEYTLGAPGASAQELSNALITSTLLSAVGTASFYAGYMSPVRIRAPRLVFPGPTFIHFKIASIAAASLAAFFMLTHEAGGLGQLLLQRGVAPDMRIEVSLEGKHWHFLVGLLKIACLVWLSLRPKVWRSAAFLGAFGLALAFGFAATGSRSGVIIPVAMAAAIWMLANRRLPSNMLIAAWLVFALLIVGVGGEFRAATRGADSLSAVKVQSGVVDGLLAGIEEIGSYSSVTDGTLAIVAAVPNRVGFIYGRSYLSVLFAPIPAVLLPFPKPLAGDRLTAIYIFNNPLSAIPPGNIGEAYWNFYIPGVIVVMFLFGIFMHFMWDMFVVNSGSAWSISLLVVTLFGLQPNSQSIFYWIQLSISAMALVLYFCGPPRLTTDRD